MNKIIINIFLSIVFFTVSTRVASAAVLTRAKLAAEVEKQAVHKLSKSVHGELKAEALLVPVESFQIPDGEMDVVVDLDNNSFAPKKYAIVTINVNGRKVKKFPTPLSLTLYRNVWVAADNIPRNKVLTDADFALEKKNITYSYAIVIPSDKNLANYIASRDIKAGDILDKRYILPRPDVSKNSVVSVIFDVGGVSIAIDAESLQSGCVGDTIKVHSNEYKKSYTGQIVGTNRVLVKI